MAKITSTDLQNAGFRAQQFGTPTDFAAYLAPLIDEASAYVAGRIGATAYALTTGDVAFSARLAELDYATSLLWRRRAAFADTNAVGSLDDSAHLNRREYESQAVNAHLRAESWITRAIDGPNAIAGAGVVLTHAETGPYAVPAA